MTKTVLVGPREVVLRFSAGLNERLEVANALAKDCRRAFGGPGSEQDNTRANR